MPLASVAGTASGTSGTAPLPSDPVLMGRPRHAQGGVPDPGANPFGATVSAAGSIGMAMR